jgi:hypothetical protein
MQIKRVYFDKKVNDRFFYDKEVEKKIIQRKMGYFDKR